MSQKIMELSINVITVTNWTRASNTIRTQYLLSLIKINMTLFSSETVECITMVFLRLYYDNGSGKLFLPPICEMHNTDWKSRWDTNIARLIYLYTEYFFLDASVRVRIFFSVHLWTCYSVGWSVLYSTQKVLRQNRLHLSLTSHFLMVGNRDP